VSRHDQSQKLKTKLRLGDTVIVIAGKSRGTKGVVKKIVSNEQAVRVQVEGCNYQKRHVKPNPRVNREGGIQTMEGLIHASNLMMWDAFDNKRRRLGIKRDENGKRIRCLKVKGELKVVGQSMV